MRATRKEVKEMLAACLVTDMDEFMKEHGFGRRGTSLRYFRRLREATQVFTVYFDLNPRYEPGAVAHLLPMVHVTLPELNAEVLRMVGDDLHLIGGGVKVTFGQQIQNAAPREARLALPVTPWFVFDIDSAHRCIAWIRAFAAQWTVPFLDRYATAAALAEGYEQRDDCLLLDMRLLLIVAAAFTLSQQPAKAMQVLEGRFAKPGLRWQYAKPFEYVSTLLGQ